MFLHNNSVPNEIILSVLLVTRHTLNHSPVEAVTIRDKYFNGMVWLSAVMALPMQDKWAFALHKDRRIHHLHLGDGK